MVLQIGSEERNYGNSLLMSANTEEFHTRLGMFLITLRISISRWEIQLGSLIAATAAYRLMIGLLDLNIAEIFQKIIQAYQQAFHLPFSLVLDLFDISLEPWAIDVLIVYMTFGGIISRSIFAAAKQVPSDSAFIADYIFKLPVTAQHLLANNVLFTNSVVQFFGRMLVFGLLIPLVTWPFNAINALRAPIVAKDLSNVPVFLSGKIPQSYTIIHFRYLILIQAGIIVFELMIALFSSIQP